MDNRKQDSFDQRFLAPLKNRPGLEPDESFVEKLRTEISQESKINNMPVKPKWRWPVLVPMAMAVLVFSVLTASFVGKDAQMDNKSGSDKIAITSDSEDSNKKDNTAKKERDIYQLINDHQAFDRLYNQISKETGSTTVGRELVYYFDALEKDDKDYLREHLEDGYSTRMLTDLVDYYKMADFTTLKVETLYKDTGAFTYQVVISYMDKERKEVVRRRLILDVTGKTIISDYVTPDSWDKEKDLLVKKKIELIENNLTYGMSKDEAEKIFGADYKIIENPEIEGEGKEEWFYQFFVEDGTKSSVESDYIVDFTNLQNQKVGIQFWIGWSSQNEAIRMTVFYTQDGQVFANYLTEEGIRKNQESSLGELKQIGDTFKLSEKERSIYDRFKLDRESKHLKELGPISVAKLYIQASLDGDAETQYALYTTRPERVRWSKEEHVGYSKNEKTSSESILASLGGIQNGKFNEENDFEGFISFETSNGPGFFQMVKDIDGIWKVAFMPIQ
jgi:hypothetical protein